MKSTNLLPKKSSLRTGRPVKATNSLNFSSLCRNYSYCLFSMM